jgi:GAF domain-containing protein
MIGKSIRINQARILQDTSEASERLATPELPDTRSELALPLRSRDHVVGALTVQSIQTNAFDEESISILQSMADQVAVALDNARLFVEAREALETTRRAYAQLSQDSWREYLRPRQSSGMVRSKDGFALLESQQKDRTAADRRSCSQALPIRLRGQVIGEIELVKSEHAGGWTPEETLLLENLMDQLGATLESARLYEETRRKAERERMASEITAKVRASNDPQAILQTAVQELRQALHANRAQVLIQAAPVPLPAAVEPVTKPRSNGASPKEAS